MEKKSGKNWDLARDEIQPSIRDGFAVMFLFSRPRGRVGGDKRPIMLAASPTESPVFSFPRLL